MKVTPHVVLDALPHAEKVGYFRPNVPMQHVRKLLNDAVLFQFPDVHGIEDHCAFAVDLYERGMFKLPFPVTAVAIERDLGPPFGKRGMMFVLVEQAEGKIGGLSCSEIDDSKYGAAVPIGIVVHAAFQKEGDRTCKVYGNSLPLVSDQVLQAMYGADGQKAAETMHSRLMNNALNSMGLVVMLMSKGVVTEHVPAPAKLNKARERNRKPRICDRYVVTLDMGQSRTICNDDGSTDDITGHRRGSPRPHWRRGHFRTIHRGGSEQRVIPVAPSLIAANEASLVTRKVYEVKAGR